MSEREILKAKMWYESSYLTDGVNSQRRYPNEEVIRFLARNFFNMPQDIRNQYRILEVGCGSCANLSMVSQEGFGAFGIDLSAEAIQISKQILASRRLTAELQVASMTSIPYEINFFDAVLDVFSSNCLNTIDFELFLCETHRVLKKGGSFFTYFPSKRSDAFLNHLPAELLDHSTLNGIYRRNSPFVGNIYPFRFLHPEEYILLLEENGFTIRSLETVSRTYRNRSEMFEHIILDAVTC